MLTKTDFAKINGFVEIYKAKEPTERESLRGEVFIKMESAVSPTEREWYGEMLQKMQALESAPVQRVEITLPDIPAQTFVNLGKYGLLVGAACVIGTVIVALIAETVAFIAAYGVYLVVAGVGLLALKCVEWRAVFGRGESGETVTERFEQETFYQKTTYEKTTTI